MAQHDYSLANQNTASYRGDLNHSLAATVSQNSGGTAPTTTYAYMLWADTATGLLKIRNAANSAWIEVGTLASTNLGIVVLSAGQQMTGSLNLDAFEDVASAGTTNIGAATSNFVRITGTTTITSFGTIAAGVWRIVRFAGALTLTHNGTSLILPGTANITTAANDRLLAISLGSGNWIVIQYQRTSGLPIAPGGGITNVTGTNSLSQADNGKFFVTSSNTTLLLPLPSSLQTGWYVDVYNTWEIGSSTSGGNDCVIVSSAGMILTTLNVPQAFYSLYGYIGENYTRVSLVNSMFQFYPRRATRNGFSTTPGGSAFGNIPICTHAKDIGVVLRCHSAANGYAIGDTIFTAGHAQQSFGAGGFGLSIATQSGGIYIVAVGGNGFLINNKSSGANEPMVDASYTFDVSFEA